MIKIFVLNIVVSVIHFISVETSVQWFEKVIKAGDSYGILSQNFINGFPVNIYQNFSDTSNKVKIKFAGYSKETNKSKISNCQVFQYRLVEDKYIIRFKYFEFGNSPPYSKT